MHIKVPTSPPATKFALRGLINQAAFVLPCSFGSHISFTHNVEEAALFTRNRDALSFVEKHRVQEVELVKVVVTAAPPVTNRSVAPIAFAQKFALDNTSEGVYGCYIAEVGQWSNSLSAARLFDTTSAAGAWAYRNRHEFVVRRIVGVQETTVAAGPQYIYTVEAL